MGGGLGQATMKQLVVILNCRNTTITVPNKALRRCVASEIVADFRQPGFRSLTFCVYSYGYSCTVRLTLLKNLLS